VITCEITGVSVCVRVLVLLECVRMCVCAAVLLETPRVPCKCVCVYVGLCAGLKCVHACVCECARRRVARRRVALSPSPASVLSGERARTHARECVHRHIRSLSISVSLTHTRTYTHAHTHIHMYARERT